MTNLPDYVRIVCERNHQKFQDIVNSNHADGFIISSSFCAEQYSADTTSELLCIMVRIPNQNSVKELLNANNELVERVRNYARISHDLRHALLYARQHCVSWQGEPNEKSCKQHKHIINVIDSALNSTQVEK